MQSLQQNGAIDFPAWTQGRENHLAEQAAGRPRIARAGLVGARYLREDQKQGGSRQLFQRHPPFGGAQQLCSGRNFQAATELESGNDQVPSSFQEVGPG